MGTPIINNDVISFHEKSVIKDVNWEIINSEQIFGLEQTEIQKIIDAAHKKDKNTDHEDGENADHPNDDYHSEDEDVNVDNPNDDYHFEDDDDDEIVTRDNLESNYAPFKDPEHVLTYISKANKEFRIEEVEHENPQALLFKCSNKNCYYRVMCSHKSGGFHIQEQTFHTCTKNNEINKNETSKLIFEYGDNMKRTRANRNKLCENLHIPNGSLKYYTVNRTFKKV